MDYEDQNQMTPENLAVVICPNLLRAPNNNFGLIMKNMGPLTVLFKALITHVRLSYYSIRIRVLISKPTQMHYIFDEDVAEEGEEGEGTRGEGEEGRGAGTQGVESVSEVLLLCLDGSLMDGFQPDASEEGGCG